MSIRATSKVSKVRTDTGTAELKRLGWQEDELGRRAKSDPQKLGLAARLRQETTLTIAQIAGRLQMGSRKSLAPKLHAWRKAHA